MDRPSISMDSDPSRRRTNGPGGEASASVIKGIIKVTPKVND